ncbi:MAG: cytochrome c oxidase accessory protein CcoG, partial [Rhizobiales bacterium]|nr:cytochrome c oxidase accessory protein CcoG [Hyphomicrobiales bacterium]
DKAGKFSDKLAHTNWRSFIRPRTIVYSVIYAAIGIALMVALLIRDRLDLNILHDRNPLFVTLSDGSVRNGYEVKILNMITHPRSFGLKIVGLPGATIRFSGSDLDQSGEIILDVGADKLRAVHLFVTVPKEHVSSDRTTFDFLVRDMNGEETVQTNSTFNAPKR